MNDEIVELENQKSFDARETILFHFGVSCEFIHVEKSISVNSNTIETV